MTILGRVVLVLALSACGDVKLPTEPAARFCSNPAPLFEYDNAIPESYVVLFHEGVNPHPEAERLAAKHDFILRSVFDRALLGFAGQMTQPAVNGVRCEQTVKEVHQNIPIIPASITDLTAHNSAR